MDASTESYCWGLGYHYHGKQESAQRTSNLISELEQQDPVDPSFRRSPSTNATTTVCHGTSTSAADVAQVLMLQCLAFHSEQEVRRQQTEQNCPMLAQSNALPEFVCPSHQPEGEHDPPPYCNNHSALPQAHEQTQQLTAILHRPDSMQTSDEGVLYPSDDTPKSLEELVEAAKVRARAVLAQFGLTGLSPITTRTIEVDAGPTNMESVSESLPQQSTQHLPHYFAQQREIGLEREEQRKHLALLKNFEYVMHIESERIGKLQAAQDQVSQWEQISQKQYQQKLEKRREYLQIQKRPEKSNDQNTRQQKRLRNNSQQKPREREPVTTAAIYVSGFPVVQPSVVDEDFVRQLFGSYGKIAKVHLYRNRQDQTLKGDGLIVYAIDDKDDVASFLESICGQVSSAALVACSHHKIVLQPSRRSPSKFPKMRPVDRCALFSPG